MRQVADPGDGSVMFGGGGGYDLRTGFRYQLRDFQPVADIGVALQTERPIRVREQIRVGRGEPGMFGACHRMPADEPDRPAYQFIYRRLDRGDVGEQAVRLDVRAYLGEQIGQRRQWYGSDRDIGVVDRGGDRVGHGKTGAGGGFAGRRV